VYQRVRPTKEVHYAVAAIVLLCLAVAPAFCGDNCRTVEGERIVARDLAAAVPEFSSVEPETPIAYSPAPGSTRAIRYPELQRLAARFHVALATTSDVCFQLATETLTEERVVEAMRALPEFAGARIELLDFSRYPAPRGRIEFPRQGLSAAPDPKAGLLWKGHVLYAGNRRFGIWARARIAATLKKVVASETLKPDRPIEAAQLKIEEYEGLPSAEPLARDIDQVVGRTPRRSISAGTDVLLSLIAQPNAIARGDNVAVEVRSGAARLGFTARAESGGGPGDLILVRNPRSGKSFQARVSEKGKVLVVTGDSQ